MHAARNGCDRAVHVLLDEGGAEINAVDNLGNGALHVSSIIVISNASQSSWVGGEKVGHKKGGS